MAQHPLDLQKKGPPKGPVFMFQLLMDHSSENR